MEPGIGPTTLTRNLLSSSQAQTRTAIAATATRCCGIGKRMPFVRNQPLSRRTLTTSKIVLRPISTVGMCQSSPAVIVSQKRLRK